MAKQTLPLTDSKIRSANAKNNNVILFDGNNLRVKVSKTGKKVFIFNYKKPSTQKRTNLKVGLYGHITLSEAREKAIYYNKLLGEGIDPADASKEAEREKANTLLDIALIWKAKKSAEIKELTLTKDWRRLELHLFKNLGTRPLADLKPLDIIDCLQPLVQQDKTHTIERICSSLNEITDLAVFSGYIKENSFMRIRKAFSASKITPLPTIRPERLPALLKAIDNSSANLSTRLLFYWQLHTLTRPREASTAKWKHIDTTTRIWTIPAADMKMKKEHKVLLSQQVIDILNVLQIVNPTSEYLFTNLANSNKPASSQSVNQLLKRNGFKHELVSHGLRSLASTILNEQGFNHDHIEKALAHQDKDNIRAIYNRAEYLEQRKEMMQWWSDHIDQHRESKVYNL